MKRPYRSPLRWTLLPLMIVAMGCGGPEPESDGPELIIETSYGRVEGAAVDDGRGPAGDVLVFRGIPYAAPPVGELRWRPPEPPASWEGVRSAHESGAPCWQGITPDTSIYSRGELDRSEDCLYLDLWTAAEAPGGGKPRPVMVWFHGGSHEMGHGSSLIFDGAALARKGVVLVSINYRLGSFGFLAHAGLSAESEHGSSGNYGLLDKIAALEWVQANAGAFGGDPERVLIFGQSAGSMSVCSLVASPLAAGLFHRAIGQSAGCFTPLPTLEQAEERGALLAAELGAAEGAAPESAVSTLRAASAEDVLAAGRQLRLVRRLQDGGRWLVPAGSARGDLRPRGTQPRTDDGRLDGRRVERPCSLRGRRSSARSSKNSWRRTTARRQRGCSRPTPPRRSRRLGRCRH